MSDALGGTSTRIPKEKQGEVQAFLADLHSYGMRMKGLLMMRNLTGLAALAEEVEGRATQFGFRDLSEVATKIRQAAIAGDFGGSMMLVGGFEAYSKDVKVEYV